MSFPRYPKYKASGVEWLGEVPEHWGLPKLKSVATFSGGGTPSRDNAAYWNGDIPWVSPKDMKAERIEGAEESITAEGLRSSASNLMPPGRILIVVRSGILKHTIPIAINETTVALNQDMKALSFDSSKCVPRFFLRWVQGHNDQLLFAWAKQGATVESIEHSYLAQTVIPLPDIPEQTAIAEFLDRETGKIDELVAEQRRLIELLKEKRQAVISHAVTKGLHPHAPMKPSGIEWLGDVPAGWSVSPIGLLCDSLSYGFTNPMPTADEGPYMLTANDVDYGRVKYESARKTTCDAFSNSITDKSRPRKGDVLLTKDGTLGRVAIHDGGSACINQSVASLRVKTNILRPEFMATCLLAGLYQSRMIYEAGGTTIKHIYISRLAKMPIAYPSLSEQESVLIFIQQELTKFDTLTAEAQRAIDLLQERRSALISAAVTGQIDVRTKVARFTDAE